MTDKPTMIHRCGPRPCRDCRLKQAEKEVKRLRGKTILENGGGGFCHCEYCVRGRERHMRSLR